MACACADIARRFGCSAAAAARHSRNHLTPAMRAAILYARKPSEIDLEALQRTEAEGILTALIAHRARHQQYIDAALEHGDIARAINADRGVISNLELTAKLLGQLVQHARGTAHLDLGERRLPRLAPERSSERCVVTLRRSRTYLTPWRRLSAQRQRKSKRSGLY